MNAFGWRDLRWRLCNCLLFLVLQEKNMFRDSWTLDHRFKVPWDQVWYVQVSLLGSIFQSGCMVFLQKVALFRRAYEWALQLLQKMSVRYWMQYLKSYNKSGEVTIRGFFHLLVHQLVTYWVCKLMSLILSSCHLLPGSLGSSFFDKAIELFTLRWYRESKVGLLSVGFKPATTARVGGIAK